MAMKSKNIGDTVEQDKLIEKQKQARLIKNILNERLHPDDEHNLTSFFLRNANIVCTTLSSCVKLSQ